MSRTYHTYRDQQLRAKTKRKRKNKKDFGFTDGQQIIKEPVWFGDSDRNLYLTELSLLTSTTVERDASQKTYAVKNKDYVKYGYGNGTKKENRVKNYKKEIE
jgi:hypothetical protein